MLPFPVFWRQTFSGKEARVSRTLRECRSRGGEIDTHCTPTGRRSPKKGCLNRFINKQPKVRKFHFSLD